MEVDTHEGKDEEHEDITGSIRERITRVHTKFTGTHDN